MPADPQPNEQPLDATLDMERPDEIRIPQLAEPDDIGIPQPVEPEEIGIPQPAEPEEPAKPQPAALDATIDMTRFEPRPEPASDAPTIQPERRKAQRESGTFQVEIPKALPAYAKKLGEVLIQMGKMTTEQVDEAVRWARESGERLGHCLIRWGIVPPEVVCRALSIQTGLPMTVLDEPSVPAPLSKVFPLALMIHHGFVPFDQSRTVICVAASNPLEPEVIKELEKISKKVIEVFLSREDQIFRQLDWLRVKQKTRSRRTPRFGISLQVQYQFCTRQGARTDKDVHDAWTINLSEGGFLLDSNAPPIEDPAAALVSGLYINACLKVPAQNAGEAEDEIWSVCEVREVRLYTPDPTLRQPRWLMGIEVIDIAPEFKEKLKRLCKNAAKRK